MSESPSININNVDIQWDTKSGTFTFFGIPAALFWISPSLMTMLKPLADEIGHSLFRLQVAFSASHGTAEDYHNMVTVLGDNFSEGFINWGAAVSTAGWGVFELVNFDESQRKARVKVSNTWELLMQKDLPKRWGCPFIQGKIIGIFSHALNCRCWADEVVVSYDKENPFVEFEIYESHKTIEDEIAKERLARMQERERILAEEVESKTVELNAAKVRAETADYAKSKFFTSVSHELRTPLNAMLGVSKRLSKDQHLTDRQAELVALLQRSSEDMVTLINQILRFTEVSSDLSHDQQEKFAPKDIIESVLEVMDSLANRKNIRLSSDISACSSGVVAGNSGYLREIMIIFISNALIYSQPDSAVEVIGADKGADNRANNEANIFRLEVIDNGPGISAEDQEKMFEPFERLHAHGKDSSGIGLGLSLAKLMANAIGATIGYRPNQPQGSVLWLEMPFNQPNTDLR